MQAARLQLEAQKAALQRELQAADQSIAAAQAAIREPAYVMHQTGPAHATRPPGQQTLSTATRPAPAPKVDSISESMAYTAEFDRTNKESDSIRDDLDYGNSRSTVPSSSMVADELHTRSVSGPYFHSQAHTELEGRSVEDEVDDEGPLVGAGDKDSCSYALSSSHDL